MEAIRKTKEEQEEKTLCTEEQAKVEDHRNERN